MNNVLFVSKSTQDLGICIRSSVVTFIIFVVLWLLPILYEYSTGWIGIILLFVILAASHIVGLLYVPYRFMLTQTHLIVKRHCGDIVLPLEEIMEIRLFSSVDKKGLWGLCRVDGVYMNYGIYSTNKHKRLHVYTRRDTNWTLVATSKRKYVFAPDDLRLADVVQKKII